MSFTNNGTKVSFPKVIYTNAGLVPVVIAEFEAENVSEKVYTVAKLDIEDPTPATGLQNLIDDITAQVTAEFTADFDTVAKVVTVYSEILSIRTNQSVTNSAAWTDAAESFDCTVKVYSKTA